MAAPHALFATWLTLILFDVPQHGRVALYGAVLFSLVRQNLNKINRWDISALQETTFLPPQGLSQQVSWALGGYESSESKYFSLQCPALNINATEFDEGGWAGMNVVATPFKVPKMEYREKTRHSETFKDIPFIWGVLKNIKEPKLLIFLFFAGGAWTALDVWKGL